jgi:hypothetical protein
MTVVTSSLWKKQHSTADLPLFKRRMGLSGLRQWVVNNSGRDLPLLHPSDELLQWLSGPGIFDLF